MKQPITLIAHRGLPERYPENTIAGIRAALEAGAQYIEVDIQLSSDGIPMLHHDETLQRTSGPEQSILRLTAEEISQRRLNYPESSPERKNTEPIATLAALTRLIQDWPDRYFFLELKRHSIEHHGAETCVQNILAVIRPVLSSVIPISFQHEAIVLFRQQADLAIGWVLREWDEAHHEIANSLQPDYLFCNISRLPDNRADVWSGRWQWVLYTVNEIQALNRLRKDGFSMIETNVFNELVDQL